MAISDWSDRWQLKFSPAKCSLLHVCPARMRNNCNHFVYHIGNTAMPSLDSVTDSGVTVFCDSKLMFRPCTGNVVFVLGIQAYNQGLCWTYSLILQHCRGMKHL